MDSNLNFRIENSPLRSGFSLCVFLDKWRKYFITLKKINNEEAQIATMALLLYHIYIYAATTSHCSIDSCYSFAKRYYHVLSLQLFLLMFYDFEHWNRMHERHFYCVAFFFCISLFSLLSSFKNEMRVKWWELIRPMITIGKQVKIKKKGLNRFF